MTNELESLRKENADLKEQITQLRASCISGFYYERIPQFSQGFPNHEVLELVTANEVQAYVDKIEELKRQLAELAEWNNQIGRTNYELRKQLEGEKAAALNYRADALDAEKQLAELKGGLTYRNSLVCHLEKQLAEYKADAAMKGATE